MVIYTDTTLNEADGSFEIVSKLMNEDYESQFGYSSESNHWVLLTQLRAEDNQFINCTFSLQLLHDGSLQIMEYEPSTKDYYENEDLQFLSQWAQDNGWDTPEPAPYLVRESKEFWVFFHKTEIIKSDFIDKTY